MQKNYSKRILSIYFSKAIGLLTGFLALVMVVPRLTSNPAIYGVYTICMSLNMFFSYADLGFISAGQKYAAEYQAQKEIEKEKEIIGFVLFIFSFFVFLCALVLFWLSLNPDLLIKSDVREDLSVGASLIFILALFSPVIIVQKFNSLVYSIRIEDYIYQSVDIFFNFLKIVLIGFFVGEEKYDIVGYFTTIQLLTLISALIGLLVAFKKFGYGHRDFFKYFRFSSKIFKKTKELAFSSLLSTFSWILYFELDSIILSKYYGVKVVALYAIGFTFLNFTRNLYNILFSPFLVRFNHYVGENDENKLFGSLQQLITFTFPICIIPPVVLCLYMKEIIMVWVGPDYLSSVFISQMFLLTSAFSALALPLNYFILAKSKNSILRINAIVLPIIFFGSMYIVDNYLLEKALAFSKVLTILLSFSLVFCYLLITVGSKISIPYLIGLKSVILPSFIMIVLFGIFNNFLIYFSYAAVFAKILTTIIIPLFVYYIFDKQMRDKIVQTFHSIDTFKKN